MIDDPHYVKWIVRLRGIRDGVGFEKILPYHKCTDADYAKFYPVAKKSKGELSAIKADPKKSLFCLDEWTEHFFVGGDDTGKDY